MFIFRLNEVELKVDKAGTRCKKQDIRTMAGAVVVVLAAPHSHNDTETKTSLMPLASWELVKSTSATLGPIKRAAWLLSFIVDGITNKVQFTCLYPH